MLNKIRKDYELPEITISSNTISNCCLITENNRLRKENELLKEELSNLKNDITRVYNTMISLEEINKYELESDVEVL